MYIIMRNAKVKKGGVAPCINEHNRTEADRLNEKGELRYPDSDIDWGKTKDNHYLLNCEKRGWQKAKEVLAEHGIERYRKDATVMIDAFYTASPEFFEGKSREEIIEFFTDCAEWHAEHYGVVINAVVHFDETTPHLHIDSVPLVKRESGQYSLSAKDIIGPKAKMSSMQTKLWKDVGKAYGLERGKIRVDDEKRKHVSLVEGKLNRLETVYEDKVRKFDAKLEAKAEVMRQEATAKLQKKVDAEKAKAASEIEEVQTAKRVAERLREQPKPIYKRDLLGKHVLVPIEDFERMQTTVGYVDAVKEMCADAQRELAQASEYNKWGKEAFDLAKSTEADCEKREKRLAQEKERVNIYISEQSTKKAKQMLDEAFAKSPHLREDRLERFMEGIKLANGMNALQAFEAHEQSRKHSISRGWER